MDGGEDGAGRWCILHGKRSEPSGGREGAVPQVPGIQCSQAPTFVSIPPWAPPVQVALLQSYEHMGRAEISCVSGCRCRTSKWDGHNPTPVSLAIMHNIQV